MGQPVFLYSREDNVFALWGIMEMTAQQVNADLIIVANKLDQKSFFSEALYVIYPE